MSIIELMHAYQYFSKYSSDHFYVEFTVALCLAVNTASTIAHYGGVYLYAVSN
ncbi:hypothetical protein DFH09DRAFT_1312891 [Mycena vulgaris]|nr:hypothetical protein DFH09DRAFT_1312891 [Mycena vulgaris]